MRRKKRRLAKEQSGLLGKLDTLGYEFEDDEAEEVEARIRRMFYGRKVEQRAETAS